MAESNGNSPEAGSESVASSSAAPADPGAHDLIVQNVGDDHAAGPHVREDLAAVGSTADGESAPAAQTDGLLSLADLLRGEQDGNLDALLTFTSDGVDTAGHDSAARGADIVLRGVGDLTGGGNLSASTIVADLLKTFGPDSV
jgi:hypothetical protein